MSFVAHVVDGGYGNFFNFFNIFFAGYDFFRKFAHRKGIRKSLGK
jgi:hypothetical protein